MDFKTAIIDALKKEFSGEILLEVPPSPELGDFAFPCFLLAKEKKKSPMLIAQELAKSLKIHGVTKIVAAGPYVNFFVDKSSLASDVVAKILKNANFGSNESGKEKHALIEHTSINPNASPHVGRARNAILGDSISRLLRFEGYKTDVHYFVNDIGKQIAMLVLASKGKHVPFKNLLQLYIDFNKKVEENPDLEKDVFAALKKLEDGDAAIKKQFRGIVDVCIAGQKAIFEEFGITYDVFDYESDYLFNKSTDAVLAELEKTGKLKTEEGQKVLDLSGVKEVESGMKNPVLVLTRNDGTSLYPLRDLAYTKDKAVWSKGRNILVLGEDQKLYFHQLSAALKMMHVSPPEALHYSFVLLAEGKMSTRKGTVVLLEDFMREAVDKAKMEILKRNHDVKGPALDKLARAIGFGAVKFTILKVSGEKNVTFDWAQALSFEGDASPYVQYAHARINSILEKAKIHAHADYSLLIHSAESNLISSLSRFPDEVAQAVKHLAPHILVAYVTSLAQTFTTFYHYCPVLKEENQALVAARIDLCKATQQVLKSALNLLGIYAPDKM